VTVGFDREMIRQVVELPWHKRRNEVLPAEAFDVDACVRIGCSERGTCGCIAAGLRPRVKFETAYFEFYPNYMGGVWGAARENASRQKVSKTKRARIIARDGRCMHCGSREGLEVDHILPVSRGGSSKDDNLQVLCSVCNRAKGTSAPGPREALHA
jgi:hypothetical protein